jgi:hypothetical protein
MNLSQHAFDIRKHVVIPEAQDAATFGHKASRTCFILRCLRAVLATVDLNDQLQLMAGKIGDVRPLRSASVGVLRI